MDAPRNRLTPEQRVSWLRLIRTENVGPATFRTLVNRFGSASAALDALPDLVQRGGGRYIKIPSPAQAEDEIAAAAKIGARFVALPEPEYPPHLRHITGPPPLVAFMGGDTAAQENTVGIVGARNASTAGRRMTQMLARDLGRSGFIVVSGLARGIDAAAHEAALDTGTIAVMAGGLDRLYPQANIALAHAIVDKGGVLLSEMPMGWEPRARDFPRRNRLIAGLSLGVVVVEAAKRSGSLITARLALEQDREVFAVPGSPLDPRAEGGNALIQQGAKLVTGAQDILCELTHATPNRANLFEADEDTIPAKAPDGQPTDTDRDRLIQAMGFTPTAVDALIADTGIAAPAMQMLLLELELAGRLERSGGQRVALKG